MFSLNAEKNRSIKNQKNVCGSRTSHTQSSCFPNNKEGMGWQRSVKRKYESEASEEFQRAEEETGRVAADVLLESYPKVLNRGFPDVSEARPGTKKEYFEAAFENPKDKNVASVQFDQGKTFDSVHVFVNEGCQNRSNSTEQIAQNLLVKGTQFIKSATDTKSVPNSEPQRLPTKKGLKQYDGSSYMDRDDASRNLSSGRRCSVFSPKSPQTFERESELQANTAESEVIALREALRAAREALNALYVELEEERNASASATNEAMAMIARLQEEKATAQMEARQFKRLSEEREAHDQQAISLLEEILTKKEEDILSLENELEAYRQIFLRIESEGWEREANQRKYLEKRISKLGMHFLEGNEEQKLYPLKGSKSWTVDQIGTITPKSIEGSQHSEVLEPRGGKGVGRLISPSLRSNLVCLFDDAGNSCESSQIHSAAGVQIELRNGGDAIGGISRGNGIPNMETQSPIGDKSLSPGHKTGVTVRNPCMTTFSPGRDKSHECSSKIGAEFVGMQSDSCDILQARQMSRFISGNANVATNACSAEQRAVSDQANSMPSVDGSLSSVWKRVRRLEERLQQIGGEQQCEIKVPDVDASVLQDDVTIKVGAFVVGSEIVPDTYLKAVKESKVDKGQCFISDDMVRSSGFYDAEERGDKHSGRYFRECLQSPPLYRGLSGGSSETNFHEIKKRASNFNCSPQGLESGDSCNQRAGDAGEGVHDVYEVPYEQKGSGTASTEHIDQESSDSKSGDCLGKPEVSCFSSLGGSQDDYVKADCSEEIMATAVEGVTLCCDEGSSTEDMDRDSFYNADKKPVETICKTPRALLDARDDHRSVAGEEVQQLTFRLQALEAERVFMKQAIESLRKENEELKLLQEIAQQLRELKGSVKNSEQPKKSLQQEQTSIFSFLKGILSFTGLQSTMQTQRNKISYAFQRNAEFGVNHGDHVGLCHLLENSHHSGKAACVRRGLKVKFPTGMEGDYSFQTPLLRQPSVY